MRKSVISLLAAAALLVPAGIAIAQAQEEQLAPPKVREGGDENDRYQKCEHHDQDELLRRPDRGRMIFVMDFAHEIPAAGLGKGAHYSGIALHRKTARRPRRWTLRGKKAMLDPLL